MRSVSSNLSRCYGVVLEWLPVAHPRASDACLWGLPGHAHSNIAVSGRLPLAQTLLLYSLQAALITPAMCALVFEVATLVLRLPIMNG